MRIRRFTLAQRLFHLLLMLCFMLQAATGLARMYVETGWGRSLARVFGGYESALSVHKAGGVALLVLFGLHLAYLVFGVGWRRLAGPDSLLPRPSDLGDFFRHLGWMLGLRPEPRFERWGYWEKFDYWAVFWGMVIIGGTGLVLYDPVASSRSMPGWGLNVAFWVHRIEALLAIGHVFVIHFFIAHLRRRSFPMDRAMFEGSVDLAHARQEKGAWIERLAAEGRLDEMSGQEARAGARAAYYAFGLSMVALGLYLLVGLLANAGRITW